MEHMGIIGLKELHCSAVYLREREVRKATMTCRTWTADTMPPVKICWDFGF